MLLASKMQPPVEVPFFAIALPFARKGSCTRVHFISYMGELWGLSITLDRQALGFRRHHIRWKPQQCVRWRRSVACKSSSLTFNSWAGYGINSAVWLATTISHCQRSFLVVSLTGARGLRTGKRTASIHGTPVYSFHPLHSSMHLLITGARLLFTLGFYTNAADMSEPWSRICGGHD